MSTEDKIKTLLNVTGRLIHSVIPLVTLPSL